MGKSESSKQNLQISGCGGTKTLKPVWMSGFLEHSSITPNDR